MKESFKQKMQENKLHLTFKNTKKNICLEKKREFFLTLTPSVHWDSASPRHGWPNDLFPITEMNSEKKMLKEILESESEDWLHPTLDCAKYNFYW